MAPSFKGQDKLPTKDKNKMRLAQRRHRYRKKSQLNEYLKEHPCVDCGEKDLRCLDFDHLRNKKKEISVMMRSGYSWESVLSEIKKCVVRCCNCHRKRTYTVLARRYSSMDRASCS